MKKLSVLVSTLLFSSYSFAHHGVASLGAAGLEGPGAPLETSSSATLPEGSWLGYMKLDYANFKKYDEQIFGTDQKDTAQFWLYGIGYGLKPYLSLYAFLPYNVKTKTDGSYNTSGFADISFMAVLGFKYDEGFKLVPKNESLDDMKDWHFTIYGGFSIPTGDENKRPAGKDIEPDMSTGFGKPSYSIGFTTTKQFSDNWTFVFDTNYIKFLEHTYNDGTRYEFGDETRFNTALVYRTITIPEKKFRLDTTIEANYLYLARDKENGEKLSESGGKILYNLLGFRAYYRNTSLGAGVKIPVWKSLNEEDQQQGCEGKEKYRFIFTFSVLF